MLDLKFILGNIDKIKENCRRRNVGFDVDMIRKMSQERSRYLSQIDIQRAKINKIAKEIGGGLNSRTKTKKIKEAKLLKLAIKKKSQKLRSIEAALKTELYKIPNLTHPDAPVGLTDKDNLEVERIGEIPVFSFPVKDHIELSRLLDLVDFRNGAEVAGSKFYYLKNEAVLLDLALVEYALNILLKEGFQPFITPDVAKLDIIDAIGYTPRGPETQIYKIEGGDLGLIATAEITLGALLQKQILARDQLPLKLAGLSHCFRKEAGTYGKASKGLYRVHQFTKVEMFIFSAPEESDDMLNYLVSIEKKIFKGIGIPFRVVDCCSGDLGGAAYRKFDLEAWLPAEKRWGEITSASNCTDYQARRLGIKFKDQKRKTKEFIHTLNGTAIATSRALLAILENFQQRDGSILIPRALQKHVGTEKIVPLRKILFNFD